MIASHARLLDRDQVSYDWQHYLPLIERNWGHYVMARRSLICPLTQEMPTSSWPGTTYRRRSDHGPSAGSRTRSLVWRPWLESVELVLESGALSAEHILNVVARLTAAPLPVTVENHLPLKDAPLANPARYDRLRVAKERGHA